MQTTIDLNNPTRRRARRDYVYNPFIIAVRVLATLGVVLVIGMSLNLYTNRNDHLHPEAPGPLGLVSLTGCLAALWWIWFSLPRDRKKKFDHFYPVAEYTRTKVADVRNAARWGCYRAGNPRPDPLSLSHDQLVRLVNLDREDQRSRNDLLHRHAKEEREREQTITAQVRDVLK